MSDNTTAFLTGEKELRRMLRTISTCTCIAMVNKVNLESFGDGVELFKDTEGLIDNTIDAWRKRHLEALKEPAIEEGRIPPVCALIEP